MKILPMCRNCVCYYCDFVGECHCPLKEWGNAQLKTCDNFKEVDPIVRKEREEERKRKSASRKNA
jgi:hypothetical protein